MSALERGERLMGGGKQGRADAWEEGKSSDQSPPPVAAGSQSELVWAQATPSSGADAVKLRRRFLFLGF